MSLPESNITIPVDVTNPGQFFACCGLLELTARLDQAAEGCFREQHFLMRTSATQVLQQFFSCRVDVDTAFMPTDLDDDAGNESDADDDFEDSQRGRTFPMRLSEPFNLLLNWWTQKEPQEQKLKTWTAGQRVTDLLNGHYKKERKRGKKGEPDKIVRIYTSSTREHFATVVRDFPNDWLRKAIPISAPAAFSYDSRLSRNNALDLGHFAKGALAFSPAIDVLTLVGLQRFRPETIETWNRNRYCTWREFLPVSVAPSVVLGRINPLIDFCFEFPVKARDSQGRFKLFGHAQPVRRPHA